MPGTKREPTPYKQGSWADAVDMPQTSFNHPSQTHAQMPTGFGFPSQSAPIQPVVDHSQSHSSSYEDQLPEIPGYRIERKLAEGGMGAVYIVRQEGTGAVRAAKTIKAKNVDVEALERFRIEYESLGLINHPNVVRVHASGVHNKVPFLVMELVEGEELGDELTEAWDPYYAAEISERILRALEAIHEHDIIHRDIKPQNIFLCEDDQPKIADFGLARVMQGEGLTKTGDILGTPAYMAPEQVVAVQSEITHQVDIWAVGVMLYQMIAGVLPYEQRNAVGIMSEIALGSYPRIEDRVPDVDRNLAAIISKAMARSQEMRYQSAADMADDLLLFIDGDTPEARQQRDQERYLKWAKRLLIFFVLFASILFGLILLQQRKNHIRDGQKMATELNINAEKHIEKWAGQFAKNESLDFEVFSKSLAKVEIQYKSDVAGFDRQFKDVIEAKDAREQSNQFGEDLEDIRRVLKNKELENLGRLKGRSQLLGLLGNICYLTARSNFNNNRVEAGAKQFQKAWEFYCQTLPGTRLLKKQNQWLLKRALISFVMARQYGVPFKVSEGLAFFNMGDLGTIIEGPKDAGSFRAKLAVLLDLIERDPVFQKKPGEAKKAVSAGLYECFEYAFSLANKGLALGAESDNAWGLGDDFTSVLTQFKEWKTPILKPSEQLEARAAPIFIEIDKLAKNIVSQGDSRAQERARSMSLPRFNKLRQFDFFFWSSGDLDRLDSDIRKLLSKIEFVRLLSFSERSQARLRMITRAFYQRECHIYLRWDFRETFLEAIRIGHEVHQTSLKGFEQIEWRIAEDSLMVANPSPSALKSARQRLKNSITQLETFLKAEACEEKTEEEMDAFLKPTKKVKDRELETMRRRKRFLLTRQFAYLIRVEMLLGREDRARDVLELKNTLEKRIAQFAEEKRIAQAREKKSGGQSLSMLATVFKMSEQTISLPIIEMIRPKLKTMTIEELDETIERVKTLMTKDKGFQHSLAFLISVYLQKALKLEDPEKRSLFASSINTLELERALGTYQSSLFPYEFYVEWIQGLLDLAELYQCFDKVLDAKRALDTAKKITDNRGHRYILELNRLVKNRLEKLRR